MTGPALEGSQLVGQIGLDICHTRSDSLTPTGCPKIQFKLNTNHPELMQASQVSVQSHKPAPTLDTNSKRSVQALLPNLPVNSGVSMTPSSVSIIARLAHRTQENVLLTIPSLL